MKTVKQCLLDRYLDLDLHRVWVSETERSAVFPLFNTLGQLVGYHQYRPDKSKTLNNHPYEGRYFTRVKEGEVAIGLIESLYLSKTLFLVEGLFDAARLTWHGYSAVACFSNNPKHLRSWLKLQRMLRPVVAVCDGDQAGRHLAKHGSSYHVMPENMDMGDAPEEYVRNFLNDYE